MQNLAGTRVDAGLIRMQRRLYCHKACSVSIPRHWCFDEGVTLSLEADGVLELDAASA